MRRSKEGRYSITSSARASTDGGTVRPIALAVFRLLTNSYLSRLHWQVGRLLAFEDAVDVARSHQNDSSTCDFLPDTLLRANSALVAITYDFR